jgi:hypothetical protein
MQQDNPKLLKVQHDRFPENELIINAVWCDVGSHKAREDEMRYMGEDGVAVCEGCYEHYN